MRLVGWLAIAIAAVAGLVWAGWTWALGRPEVGLQIYQRAVTAEQTAAAAVRGDPGAMRAMACGAGPCVLVEAGGLAFLFGAGEGAAGFLSSSGYSTKGVDLVLLGDLSAASVAELGAIRRLTWLEGRRAPLRVVGPAGVGAVVDGVNLAWGASDRLDMQAHEKLPLSMQAAGLAAGPPVTDGQGQTVFDSGVVAIQAFPLGGAAVAEKLMYRVDVGERSIIVAPCGVTEADVVRAAIGADRTALVAPAVNAELEGIRREAMAVAGRTRASALEAASLAGCPDIDAVMAMARASRSSAVLLAPLFPVPDTEAGLRVARAAEDRVTGQGGVFGLPGASVSLEPAAATAQPTP